MSEPPSVKEAERRWKRAREWGTVPGYVVADRLMVAMARRYLTDLTLDIYRGLNGLYNCPDN
jgi:hypothetical protein